MSINTEYNYNSELTIEQIQPKNSNLKFTYYKNGKKTKNYFSSDYVIYKQ